MTGAPSFIGYPDSKALLVIRCIRTNERCVDKSQTREMEKRPILQGPLCGSKVAYRSKARPQKDPIFKVQTTQMGLGYTQCIVTSQRPTRVREVSPDTALISLVASVQDEMECPQGAIKTKEQHLCCILADPPDRLGRFPTFFSLSNFDSGTCVY